MATEFTTEEKKKLNEFLDKYQYLLEEGDYVNFLNEYRKQNNNTRNALYYRFVDLIKDTFNLNIEWFIKNDPDFYWINYFEEGSGITHIDIPNGVTVIGEYAFWFCSSLTSINIPDNVTTIGVDAFRGCSNLTIYCEADSKPKGWNADWNSSNCPVVWGYKKN